MKKLIPITCPWCEKAQDRPIELSAGVVTTKGNRCDCGALYVADVTGRQGGECLIDALTLLCDGDMNESTALVEGQDYALVDICYRPRTHSVESKRPGPRSFGQSKLWFVIRLEAKS
jgi:hypothetical protein